MDRAFDPESLNKYAYARLDPINYIDPDGKTPVPFICWMIPGYVDLARDRNVPAQINCALLNPAPPNGPVPARLDREPRPDRPAFIFEGFGEDLQWLVEQILAADAAVAEAINQNPDPLGKYRDCISQIFNEGTKPGVFTNKRVKFKYTGSLRYSAHANYMGNRFVGGSTIDIGKPSTVGTLTGLYSGSYTLPGFFDGPEATILHEALHLCGAKNNVEIDKIVNQYFKPLKL